MNYFSDLIIASQVEEGDRAPKRRETYKKPSSPISRSTKTVIALIVFAVALMVATAWLFPSAPFNGLSLIAFVALSVAVVIVSTTNEGK